MKKLIFIFLVFIPMMFVVTCSSELLVPPSNSSDDNPEGNPIDVTAFLNSVRGQHTGTRDPDTGFFFGGDGRSVAIREPNEATRTYYFNEAESSVRAKYHNENEYITFFKDGGELKVIINGETSNEGILKENTEDWFINDNDLAEMGKVYSRDATNFLNSVRGKHTGTKDPDRGWFFDGNGRSFSEAKPSNPHPLTYYFKEMKSSTKAIYRYLEFSLIDEGKYIDATVEIYNNGTINFSNFYGDSGSLELKVDYDWNVDGEGDIRLPQELGFEKSADVEGYNNLHFSYSLAKSGNSYSGDINITGIDQGVARADWSANDIRQDVLEKLNSLIIESGAEFESLENITISEDKKTVTFSLITDQSTLPEGVGTQTYTFEVTSQTEKLHFHNEDTHLELQPLLPIPMPETLNFTAIADGTEYDLSFNYSLAKSGNSYSGDISISGLPTDVRKADWTANAVRYDVLEKLNNELSESGIELELLENVQVTQGEKTVTFSLRSKPHENFEVQTYTFTVTSQTEKLYFNNGEYTFLTLWSNLMPRNIDFTTSADGTKYDLDFHYSLVKSGDKYIGNITISGLAENVTEVYWRDNDIRNDVLEKLNDELSESGVEFVQEGLITITQEKMLTFYLRSVDHEHFESQTYTFEVTSQTEKLYFHDNPTDLREDIMPKNLTFESWAGGVVRDDLFFDYSLRREGNRFAGNVNLRNDYPYLEGVWNIEYIRFGVLNYINHYFQSFGIQFVADGEILITGPKTIVFDLTSTVSGVFEDDTYTFTVTALDKVAITEGESILIIDTTDIPSLPNVVENYVNVKHYNNIHQQTLTMTNVWNTTYKGIVHIWDMQMNSGYTDAGAGAIRILDAIFEDYVGFHFVNNTTNFSLYRKVDEIIHIPPYSYYKKWLHFDVTPHIEEGYELKQGTWIYKFEMLMSNVNDHTDVFEWKER